MYGYIATDQDGSRNFFPLEPPHRDGGKWQPAEGCESMVLTAGVEPLTLHKQTYADDPAECDMEIFTKKSIERI